MKFLVICVVFCAAVLLATAEKNQPNQENLQLSPSNLPVNPTNVKPAQVPIPTTLGSVPSNLVDVKRIVDRVSTHLPRIFTWRSWNHWIDSNANKLKQNFDIVTGEGLAFADKSFVLTFRSGSDASDVTKPLVTSAWKAPLDKCPTPNDCRFKGLLIFDADSRPVAVLIWQAADKQIVRTYNENTWTPVEAAKFNNWFRFVQKSLDQNAPKLILPLLPLAPDQQATSTTTVRATTRKDSRRA